jgi:hypothetical protein
MISVTQYELCILYISNLDTVKLKLATSILEFGAAKPSSVVPMGITVKASANIHLAGIGLVGSVDCEHGARMDRFAPA